MVSSESKADLEFEMFLVGQDVSYETYQLHLSRYHFATTLVKDKIVLDAATGMGYGSWMLSKAARYVLGCDISKRAIGLAKKNFDNAKTDYLCANAEMLPFATGTFDAVVSFETVEHVDDYFLFLSECARVLKQEGLFICSTPNKLIWTPFLRHKTSWAYHHKEFTSSELLSITRVLLGSAQLYGQLPLRSSERIKWYIRRVLATIGNTILGREIVNKVALYIFSSSRKVITFDKNFISLDPRFFVKRVTRGYEPLFIIIVAKKTRSS